MTEAVRERLYHLLPTLYRQRDLAEGQPLRALLAVLESEYNQVQKDIGAIYDDWFVETCDDWVLPYLAELLGIEDLSEQGVLITGQRRRIANTLGYRRRKGTTAVLEHALHDVTGWPVYAAELFRYLSASQHLGHTRPESGRLVDVRQSLSLAQLNGPFDTLAHTPDLRQDGLVNGRQWPEQLSANGRHTLRRLALHVWRLNSYPLERTPARLVETATTANEHGQRQVAFFTFDILGRDMPHYHRPQPIQDIADRPAPQDLPLALSREILTADLADFRNQDPARVSADRRQNSMFYGPNRPLYIYFSGQGLGAPHVVAGSLKPWPAADGLAYLIEQLPADASQPYRAIIDPEAGRLALILPPGDERRVHTGDAQINYAYGFAADIGAGPYERYRALTVASEATLQVDVFKAAAPGPTADGRFQARSLQEALGYWDNYCDTVAASGQSAADRQARGVIRILDNGLYGDVIRPLDIRLETGAQLTIIAGDGLRPVIRVPRSLRVPMVREWPEVVSFAYEEEEQPIRRRLRLSGLLIEGPIIVQPIEEGTLSLEIESCTLLPDGIQVAESAVAAAASDTPRLGLHIERSIVGPLRLPAAICGELHLAMSIVDGAEAGQAILIEPGPQTPEITLEKATIFGPVTLPRLTSATAVIFNDGLETGGSRPGKMVYCYRPPQKPGPIFTSTEHGRPGYAQLSHLCPPEIRSGAPNGGEIGVFHDLYELRRERNLQRMLDTYLPSGLTVSLHYQS